MRGGRCGIKTLFSLRAVHLVCDQQLWVLNSYKALAAREQLINDRLLFGTPNLSLRADHFVVLFNIPISYFVSALADARQPFTKTGYTNCRRNL